jgi:hypothetical protein
MPGLGTHATDGLAINQLLKLKASGRITLAQFLDGQNDGLASSKAR